jgi:prepilin-type processing-associated H-X9-DG protein
MKSSINLKPLDVVGRLRVGSPAGARNWHYCEHPGPHLAFTRIELVAAVVVSCLLVAALFLPAFPSGKARARRAVCVDNLREIDSGLNQYAVESHQFLNAAEWASVTMDSTRMEPYLPRDPEAVISPNEITGLKQSYIPQQPQLPSARHRGGANILFCDGHVEFGKQSKWIEKTPEARRQWNNDNQPHPETW